MKDKICNICKTAIDTNKPFCKFTHYKKTDDISSKAYYHVECFKERLTGSMKLNALQNKASQILNKAEGLIS